MVLLRSSRANPQTQAAQIPANHSLDSESRPEHHLYSQTITTDLPSGEPPKAPPALSLSTGLLTPECTSQQQQPLGGLQTDPPIGGATSGEPSTAENLPVSPPALENPSNGQPTTNSLPRWYQPVENSAKNPPVAEDLSRILVTEVISTGASISKRTFEEMDDSVIIITDDEDEPPLKRHKVEAISHINILIKKTKAEQANAEYKTCDQLQRRRNGLADARRYILDHEIDPMTNELHHTPLSAIQGAITENKRAIAEAKGKFYDVYKGGILDDQSEVLERYSSLERWRKPPGETRRYILDLAQ